MHAKGIPLKTCGEQIADFEVPYRPGGALRIEEPGSETICALLTFSSGTIIPATETADQTQPSFLNC